MIEMSIFGSNKYRIADEGRKITDDSPDKGETALEWNSRLPSKYHEGLDHFWELNSNPPNSLPIFIVKLLLPSEPLAKMDYFQQAKATEIKRLCKKNVKETVNETKSL